MGPGVLDTVGLVNPVTQAPEDAPEDPTAAGDSPAVDGRALRWQRHRVERRAELLDLARHVIHERGPDVTMADIATASGTSKSIVYRYIDDKEQLQRLLGERILSSMHQRLLCGNRDLEKRLARPASPEERIRQMIAAYVATVERSPNVYYFVTRPSAGLNHFLGQIARMIASFLPTSVPAPQLWASGAVGFVEASVARWMQDPNGVDADALADHLTTWLMKGLQP